MQITRLLTYPVKSLPGIDLQEAAVTPRGLELDRRWLIIDKDGKAITQRSHPRLALFKLEIKETFIIIYDTCTGDHVLIENGFFEGEEFQVSVWNDSFSGVEVSKRISNWFSSILDQSVKLVFQPDSSKRLLKEVYWFGKKREVSAADSQPILIVSEESVALISEKMGVEVDPLRFRPNIIINGVEPHGEDNLDHLHVGDVKFRATKRCGRCKMIEINPSNGVSDLQLLKPLSSYRKIDNNITFGQYFLPVSLGNLRIGDKLRNFNE